MQASVLYTCTLYMYMYVMCMYQLVVWLLLLKQVGF